MLRRLLLPAALLLAATPAAAIADGPGPAAQASKSCSLSAAEGRNLGTTYVTQLSASGVSCGKAKGVVKAYHACRHQHGKGGKCASKVKGYECTEKRLGSSPVSYDARATCTKGGKKVVHTYQQNT